MATKKDHNEDAYQESVMKEFAGNSYKEEPEVQEQPKPETGLGTVDLARYKREQRQRINEDENMQRMMALTDYHTLAKETLPSQGRFYPENFTIHIRACRVDEIREFSGVDETNPNDVLDKLSYIIASCTKVYEGDMLRSYKDLLDHDRLSVIFAIRELTFKNGETRIRIPVPAGACKTPGCKPQTEVLFTRDMFETA